MSSQDLASKNIHRILEVSEKKKKKSNNNKPQTPFPLRTVNRQRSDAVDLMILANFAQESSPLDTIACLHVGKEIQLCQQSLILGIQNYICLLYMTFLLCLM